MLRKPTERGREKPAVDGEEKEAGAENVSAAGRGRGRVKLQPQEAQVGRGRPQEVAVGRGQSHEVHVGRGHPQEIAVGRGQPHEVHVGRGHPQEIPMGRGQPQEAAVGKVSVGRGRGRVYSSAGTGDRPEGGRGRAQQFQDADGLKSVGSSVTPMSTPGMSAGLSWSTTPEKPSSDDASRLSAGISTRGRSPSRSGRSTPEKSSSVSPASTPGRSAGLSWGSTSQEGSPFRTPKNTLVQRARRTRSFYVEHSDENDNQCGLKKTENRMAARVKGSEGVENHCDSNRAEKKMKLRDGCDNPVKRRTRSFYLDRDEGNEKRKKNETPTCDKDEYADGNEKLEKNKTSAGVKVSNVSNKNSINKTAKNEARGKRNDYDLPPPDENTCQISNDREDCCKTMCKICDQPYALTKMRFHTLKEHNLQISKYKEKYGPFVIIDAVYHKCAICGKLILLDSDFLGAHIKNKHKMKESVYYDLYMITTKGSSQLEDDVDETDDGFDIKIVVELYPKEDDSGGDADGLKSVGSSANILAAPSSSPAEPEGAKSVSGSATPLPSTASASMASTPHKSGPVTPMSTPGMSAEDLSSHVKNEASCEDISYVKEEQLSDDPREWTIAQTLSSIIRMDPTIDPEDLHPIRKQHIDGSALIQLKFHDIVTSTRLKSDRPSK